MNRIAPRDLKPTLRPTQDGLTVRCPLCGELDGAHRFEPLARRTFEEHCDEEHGAPTPLEAALAAVPLVRTRAGQWTAETTAGTYTVRQTGEGFTVELPGGAHLRGTFGSRPEAQICIARAAGLITTGQAEAARLSARSPARARRDVVSVLNTRMHQAKEHAAARGMPQDAPWSVTVGQPEVNEFGGAEKVRSAARAAARQLGIRVHTFATDSDDRSPEQLVVIGNLGAPFRPRPEPQADPRWPAFAPARDAEAGTGCVCRRGPCLSAGLDAAAGEEWPVVDWLSLTPATDLRTLPAELRSRDPGALLAGSRSHPGSDDRVDLSPFQDGAALGPLGDVQVYASNPHGYYKGMSHGVGCSWAPEVDAQHEILTLAEFLPLLPVAEPQFGPGFDTVAELWEQILFKDRSGERWCASCGGFAVRRLTPEQCTYYRRCHKSAR
ncbi:hypothetical protein OG413_45210 [Streptomyces sp. NBC_01433]|uniref:hypothetical protein n=1 Tax=Streptomyces sp. NBC_01433 TaxID=2903864 RepID=UPI002251F2B5|nr:hypothetical protein [Streptomyces sp. NBC_01433]MCX4681309.1 hypothetical protein [Streptomyces sp. NBC_01433]MCX4682386.1 hypothetical protein [Streptomyces sp. NBC_01433]